MEGWKRGGALLGRFMLSLIFLIAGSEKFANMVRTQHYMAAMGMPHSIVPPLAYIAAVIEVTCGLAVLLGFQARVAAIILFLFLIPVTIIFHLIPHEMVQVWKNVAMMGGLLMVAVHGPGGLSLDRRQA